VWSRLAPEVREALAGGLAHDFNNLLTAVLSSCEVLGSELPVDSPQWEDVNAIRNAGQRGAELTTMRW
jgi:two-component system, cell cycle sensor histidine kinase and response regulator CckA